MNYITEQGLANFKAHKHKRNPATALELFLNEILWNPAVHYIPKVFVVVISQWLAPNLITLIGFLLLASSVILILCYDTSLSKELPRWIYLYTAATIFAYEGLDSIDSKQAMRTSSLNPLTQFFDQLCDAFACTCLSIIGCQLLLLGNSLLSMGFHFVLNMSFFMAHWEYSHIGTFRNSIGGVWVVEAQWIYIVLLVISGIYGAEIWRGFLSNLIASFTLVMYFLIRFRCTILALQITRKILKNNKQKLNSLAMLIPIIITMGLAMSWIWTKYYNERPAIVLLIVGLEFFVINAKFIVSSMCQVKLTIKECR